MKQEIMFEEEKLMEERIRLDAELGIRTRPHTKCDHTIV